MGYSSQAGHIGIKTQTVKGTYLDPGAAAPNAGIFLRYRGGALSSSRELMIPDPEIGGTRDVPDADLGPIAFSGEYDFYARMDALPTLLRAVLGGGASATDGSGDALVGTHTLSTANALPWLSVEEAISDGYETFNYTDAMANTLHLEVDAGGYLMGTIGLVALKGEGGKTRTVAPDFDLSPMTVGSKVVVEYDGVDLRGKSFSLDINNNLEDDDFRLGSIFLGDLVPKRREVTMSVTIRPQDSSLWRAATYGAAAATAPIAGAAVKEEVTFHSETYASIGTSSEKYTLDLTFPKVAIQPFAVEPSGDDIIEHDIEMQALRPDPTVDIVTAVVKNGLEAIR